MNRNSPEWHGLRAKIVAEIESQRDELESPGMDPGQARGRIAGLRWVIKQVEPDPPVEVKPAPTY